MLYTEEQPHHAALVEDLHQQVFKTRPNGASARLRASSPPVAVLNILAIDTRAGQLAGSVRGFAVSAGAVTAALVSPLAVHPNYQGRKYPDWNGEKSLGRSLMDRFCTAARQAGFGLVVLKASTPEAHDFYVRNGFYPMEWSRLAWPSAAEAPAALVKPLQSGILARAMGPVAALKPAASRSIHKPVPA